MRFSLSFGSACALAAALLLTGCELASDTPDATVAPSAFDARSAAGSLEAYAAELNESEEGEAFYFALQYAAAEAYGPVLYAQFVPGDAAGDVEAERAAFCADLGEQEGACHDVSEQADALAADAGLDLVTLGVAMTLPGTYERITEGFDVAIKQPCPPPPGPLFADRMLTYAPNGEFGVDRSPSGEEALGLAFEECPECERPSEHLAWTERAFEVMEEPKCPKTGCVCDIVLE